MKRLQLEKNSLRICADEEDIFEEHHAILQEHLVVRELVFSKMLQKMDFQLPGKKKKKQGELKKQEQNQEKKQRVRMRAAEAKRGLPEEYVAKCTQYLDEGCSRQMLASRLLLSSKSRKNKEKKLCTRCRSSSLKFLVEATRS